jgi:hypothetical protein
LFEVLILIADFDFIFREFPAYPTINLRGREPTKTGGFLTRRRMATGLVRFITFVGLEF